MMKTKIITFILLTGTALIFSCAKHENAKTEDAQISIKNKIVAGVPSGALWDFDASRSDEFNSFDNTKWSNDPLWYDGGVSGKFAYKNANAYVSGGYAHLAARKEKHQNGTDAQYFRNYTAGCLKSKFEVGDNTYTEVSAKLVNHLANVCSAIWLGDEPADNKNPNIEIDLHESKEPLTKPNVFNCSLLDWPRPYNPNHVNNNLGTWFHTETANLDAGFHTYGVERRAGRLRIFVDELLRFDSNTATFNAGKTFLPEYMTQLRPLILSIEGHAGDPVDTQLPAELLIDWVHVFKVK